MKFFLFSSRRKVNNKGISLLELIIAITIMAVLVGVITPQYVKYLNKSKKAVDLANAEKIAKAFEHIIIDNPEFYDFYTYEANKKGIKIEVVANWHGEGNKSKKVPGQKVGEKSYTMYSLISSEDFGVFSGGAFKDSPKNKDGLNIYDALNEELGIRFESTAKMQEYQRNHGGYDKNDIMVPKYKIKPNFDERRGYVDRWRICKRADGQLEIWTAENSVSGDGGGYPCYRLWPVPCDAYAE